MQEIESNKQANDLNDEIDLRELFFVLVQGKWIITFMTAFFLIVGIIYKIAPHWAGNR